VNQKDGLEALAEAYAEEQLLADENRPGFTPAPKTLFWSPDLNPVQYKIFSDESSYILGYGEKGSGKTIGFLHKLVFHCFNNDDALALIISPSMRAGQEGAWHDLMTLVIPTWVDGIGLEHTEQRLDPNTKDRHIWIGTKNGGWSKVMLISIPYSEAVQPRIKGPAPSFIYVDELTQCDGRDYFTYPAAQLKRRRQVTGVQQFTASCNPEGPSHWVYKTFLEEPVNPETGERDPRFAVYHVPITENLHRLPKDYVDSLKAILKHDPVEEARLIRGEWIDRPSGASIFKPFYTPEIHRKGDAIKRHGLLPRVGHPLVIGYDLGTANSSVTFLQHIPTKQKNVWLVIDELDYIGTYQPYSRLVPEILQRIKLWSGRTGYEFSAIHISDDSAFNQYRAATGSFDAWEVERLSGGKIKLKPCPKGPHTVPARVRLLVAKLQQDEVFISATCHNTHEMLMHLESEKVSASSGKGKWEPELAWKPKRSRHIHKFDSLTYPMFYYEVGPSAEISLSKETDRTICYSLGSETLALRTNPY